MVAHWPLVRQTRDNPMKRMIASDKTSKRHDKAGDAARLENRFMGILGHLISPFLHNDAWNA